MKIKNLKIDQKCNENWQNMEPNKEGKFCELCSKSVVDFTVLTKKEILQKLQVSNGSICARVRRSQLRTPLFEVDKSNHYRLPYSRVAAGIMLAASIASIQSCEVNPIQIGSEISLVESSEISNSKLQNENGKDDSSISFTGKILSEKNAPINNAKVSYVTINGFYTDFTDESGKFTIEIPKKLISAENVVQISFDDFISDNNDDSWEYYETDVLILNGKQLYEDFIFTAEIDHLYLGGIGLYAYEMENNPVVIDNGVEVPFSEFNKARFGDSDTFNIENKECYYFTSEAAIALYGEKAKNGLYLFFEL